MAWVLKTFPAFLIFGLLVAVPPPPASANGSAPVVVIVMENHSYGPTDPGVKGRTTKYIVGNPDAPYINGTLIPQGTLFSNDLAGGSQSLPNYLLMTAGADGGCPTNVCSPDSIPLDNVFHQLGAAGDSFNTFVQSMPENCRASDSGLYPANHNPEIYLTDVDAASGLPYACPVTDVPAPASWPDPLPMFSFVVPDRCNSMHGTKSTGACPPGTDQLITTGDTWLSQNVPRFLALGAIVIVTFDEGIAADTTGGGGHVLTLMVGPNVGTGVVDALSYSHPSLLAGIEDYFGLARLAGAATVTPLPIPIGSPPPAPTVDGFTPDSGSSGDQVTITGTGLTGASAVRFNGTLSPFTVLDDATIVTTVPSGATTGSISVRTPAGSGVSAASFTVTTPPPVLVQHALTQGSSATPTGLWPQPTAEGDLLVASIGWKGTGAPSTPPGWSLAVQGKGVAIYYEAASPVATGPVSIPSSGSAAWIVDLTEWSGIASAGALDATASDTSGTVLAILASSGTTASTAQSSEIAIAVLTALSAVNQSAPTNGFTPRDVASQGSNITAGFYDSTLLTVGARSVSVSLSAPAKWRGAIATFRGL